MHIQVRKWGDSMGIRIPADYCRKLNIHAGSRLEVILKGDKLTIIPKKSKLDEMLEMMSPKTFHETLLEGQAVGNEEW